MQTAALCFNPRPELLSLAGEITKRSALELVSRIRDTDTSATLFINSPGGSVDGAFFIAESIEEHALPITGLVTGSIKSAANIVLQACHTRAMKKGTEMQLHLVSGSFKSTYQTLPGGRFSPYAIKQIERSFKDVERRTADKNQRMFALIAERSGLTKEEVEHLCRTESIFDPEGARQKNLIDLVL